jgi:glutamate formiminotransferase
MAAAIAGVNSVRVLDYSSDGAHNRSVFTFVGDAAGLANAVLALYARAVVDIDIRTHRGEHPRVGAVDVVPFVPLGDSTLALCVTLAESVGHAVADIFDIPVFLYEAASRRPWRRNLEDIRRGQLDALATRMREPDWAPDFGPDAPHPTAGVTVIGARLPLVAYNVNLTTDRLDIARRVAAAVRQSNGGLPHVKAIGVSLSDRRIVQVSMNLTNYEVTPIPVAFAAVQQEAAKFGVGVLESEVIGLMPRAAMGTATAADLLLARFSETQILENHLRGSRPAD